MDITQEEYDQLTQQRSEGVAPVGEPKKKPYWEDSAAPPGSTIESLAVYENGEPVRVAGPSHYHHLANGRIVPGYSGGTHYTEPNPNGGPDKILQIVASYEG